MASEEAEAFRSSPVLRRVDRTVALLCAPVDAAGLIVFRVAFGLIAAWWAIDDLCTGRVTELYVNPQLHFSYWRFDWVRPWPGAGPYLHFLLLAASAACIAVGLAYRWATLTFAIGFTIFFLWDRTNYQNHYYLLLLLSWVVVCLPLNLACSLDVVDHPESASSVVPRWALWLVRFHIALPYVFGGISKLNADWLAGAGLRDYLITKTDVPLIGPWLGTPAAAVGIAWGGLLFDLSIVPLLMWKPTRLPAYVTAVLFHIANQFLFSIHIFPWFMIATTTVFFSPDWPRRLLRLPSAAIPPAGPMNWRSLPARRRSLCVVAAAFLALQLLLPFRHHLYGGDAGWHEHGHYFAWRMMLRTKQAVMRIYMTDPTTGDTWNVDLRTILSAEQLLKCPRDPETMRQLAHQLRARYQRETGRTPEIKALVLASYNGRRPQLLIDPTVDLSTLTSSVGVPAWVMPQRLPSPDQPWQRPVEEWQQSVELPPLPQITRGPRGERLADQGADDAA
jgi:vitamin K-dependent gamma-carboxylase